jgi:hypothetical protein
MRRAVRLAVIAAATLGSLLVPTQKAWAQG